MNEQKFSLEEISRQNPFQNLNESIETLSLENEMGKEDINQNLMNPSFEINNTSNSNYTDIHTYQETIKKLETKLKSRSLAMALPAVITLIVLINIAWFVGIRFFITPKYEEAMQLNETMKDEYESLKSKVNAIVGDES